MLKIEPYKAGDVYKVKIRAQDVWYDVSEDSFDHSMAYTIVDESGGVYLVAGINRIYRGVGIVWSYISDDCKGHALGVIRLAKKAIGLLMEVHKFHRVHCTVNPANAGYGKFVETIGFKFESVVEKGSPAGEDLEMYCIVR